MVQKHAQVCIVFEKLILPVTPQIEGCQETPRLLHDQFHPLFFDGITVLDAGMVFATSRVLGKLVPESRIDVQVRVFGEKASHIGGPVNRAPVAVTDLTQMAPDHLCTGKSPKHFFKRRQKGVLNFVVDLKGES